MSKQLAGGHSRWRAGACAAAMIFAPVVAAGEPPIRQETTTFLQILSFGIEINVALVALFFVAIFLFLLNLLVTRRRKVMPLDLMRQVQDYVAAGNIEGAISVCTRRDNLFSRVILPGLKLHSHSHERIVAAMDAAGRRALGSFRQKINYISNIATISPMLGLLGTVLGLTKAFNAMGADGPEGMRSTLMTAYIGEAMGTTVVGLLVGIPAMAGYYFCISRLGRLSDDLECAAEDIAAIMAENQRLAQVSGAAKVEEAQTPPSESARLRASGEGL